MSESETPKPRIRSRAPSRKRSPGRPAGKRGDADAAGLRSQLLDAAIACFVRKGIAATTLREIARERRLPDALVEAMRRAGIFRIAFPRDWGGPEMDMLRQCELMETLAYHDASAAWVAMICSDSGHYAMRVAEPAAREIYPDIDLLTSGWLAPVGQARQVDGGYRVTGRWQFGSGCLHADRMIGGCMLLVDGAPVVPDAGWQMHHGEKDYDWSAYPPSWKSALRVREERACESTFSRARLARSQRAGPSGSTWFRGVGTAGIGAGSRSRC